MSKFEKLQKNTDNKLLRIKYIGSRGEGISNLTTEINYRVNNYTFFIPFTLPDEIVIVKPTLSNSEGVRANLVEIKKLTNKYNLHLIEDAAQSHGAKNKKNLNITNSNTNSNRSTPPTYARKNFNYSKIINVSIYCFLRNTIA